MSGNLTALFAQLSSLPTHLSALLDYRALSLFVNLFAAIKPSLLWYQSLDRHAPPLPTMGPPTMLSNNLQEFFAAALGIPRDHFPRSWSALGEWLWYSCPPCPELSGEVLEAFRLHGAHRKIAAFNLYPPHRTCIHPACNYVTGSLAGTPRILGLPRSVSAVYFTREHGPIPAMSHSLKCDHCNSRYYSNYFTDAVTQTRTYYRGIPAAILLTPHVIIETSLCYRFTWSTVCAWVSFTNNARIYNLEHSDARERFPEAFRSIQPDLSPSLLSDLFFLFALLRDRDEEGLCLVHSSHGEQSDRLDALLQDRTLRWAGPGRENWDHVCNKCRLQKDVSGSRHAIRAVVVDGITIGRPCCNVHDCQNPLPTQRSRFCETHRDLKMICAVVGCNQHASPNKQTCPEPSHRALEDPNGRSALFILRRRLERLQTSSLEDEGTGVSEELTEYDENGECPSKSEEGNTKPRARFGRRQTHNEQLVVATCGVILGRATMFGSEGIDGVMQFLKNMFPLLLPQVIFFDNACSLKKHVIALKEKHFDNCIMPVDAFHAKTKHKESDNFCNQHCNAAQWPELFNGDKWIFNSSAAEMTNAWLGGFQAMVREMRAAHYDFFLDEVIKWRNRLTIEELSRVGADPKLLN
ncbi:hypothetical protein BD309DRAFT_1005086 [Dichomitus squalens]|nr:hypothetical protein BD309DRAFT_1005086 [Dichomitus squalens]